MAKDQALVAAAWAVEGTVPRRRLPRSPPLPPIDPALWKAREDETRHDVAAFVDVLAAACREHGRWVHYGLTSSDILDTSLGVQMQEASRLLQERLITLFTSVQRLALRAPHDGHGGADPRHVGGADNLRSQACRIRLRSWCARIAGSSLRRIPSQHGKISGPVGTHSTVPASVEESVVTSLGLHAEPAATQVVGRDRHAAFLSTLAGVGATLERFATEIRHLQRSEVGEVSEPFTETQKGLIGDAPQAQPDSL